MQWCDHSSVALTSQAQTTLSPQSPEGLQDSPALQSCMDHHAQLSQFVFLETGSHYVAQTDGDPPTSASQSPGTIGAHHHAHLIKIHFFFCRNKILPHHLGCSQTPRLRLSSCLGFPKCWNVFYKEAFALCFLRVISGVYNRCCDNQFSIRILLVF